MLKQTLFLILLLFITVHKASARSYSLSHEDFVHLTDQEKDQLIIKTMELAVEVEARYEKDLVTYGFDQNRYDKYVKAITTLSKLFLDEAHADAAKDWSAMGNEFIQLLKRPESRCMFAGWISTPSKISQDKTVCNHPGNLSKSAPEAKSYPAPQKNSECKPGDPKKIQCSPVLFGYKKEADQSLFCVDASDGAHNSSFNCMKEALAEGSAQKGDPKDTRLKNLRDRLSKNPEIFKGVQDFTYKTCVCEELDGSVNFNKKYHEYMRPHRTCYGLMEMMGETLICEDPKLPMDASIFKALRDYAKNKVVKGADADALYKSFLKTEVMKTAPEEYKRLCSNGESSKMQVVNVTGKKEYLCNASCGPGKDKDSKFECTYVITNYKKDRTIVPRDHVTEIPKSKDEKSIEISNFIEGVQRKVKCELTFTEPEKKDDSKKPTLKIEKTVQDKDVKIKAIPTDKGDWKIIWKTHQSAKKEEKKHEVKIKVTETTDTSKEEKTEDKKSEESKPKQDENVTEGDEDSEEITRQRQGDKYKVCAELRKGTDVVPATPSCLDIDPLEGGGKVDANQNKPAPRPNPMGNGGQMPMPQQMIRGTSDASALGIK